MSERSHSVTAAVDHRLVWERWTNTDHWPTDHPFVARAQINGPLAKGAGGIVFPPRGRRQGFRIMEADQQRHRFAVRFALLLAYLTLEYSLERPQPSASASDPAPDEDDELRADGSPDEDASDEDGPATEPDADTLSPDAWVITHKVVIKGPAARLWDRLRGRAIAASFPDAIATIVRTAAV